MCDCVPEVPLMMILLIYSAFWSDILLSGSIWAGDSIATFSLKGENADHSVTIDHLGSQWERWDMVEESPLFISLPIAYEQSFSTVLDGNSKLDSPICLSAQTYNMV
jgi:hypothetical protein